MDGAREEEVSASAIYNLRLDSKLLIPANNRVVSREEVSRENVDQNLLYDPYVFLKSDEDVKSDPKLTRWKVNYSLYDSCEEEFDDCGSANFNDEADGELDDDEDEDADREFAEKLLVPVNNRVDSCEEVSHEYVDPNLSYDPSFFLNCDEAKLTGKVNYTMYDPCDEEESDDCGGTNYNDETNEESDEDEDEYEDDDPEFADVKRKIWFLSARGWKEIWFFAGSMENAYSCLILKTDPRGFWIEFHDLISSTDCEFDMQYLKLLRRLDESEQIKLANQESTNLENLEKMTSDLPLISAEVAMNSCYQDYLEIYVPGEVFTQWSHMHGYLFNSVSNSKEEYFQDPDGFRDKLTKRFPFASCHFDNVYNAVTQWWGSKSEEEGRIAKSIGDFGLKTAQENFEGRLKAYYTRGDYFKLKLEFARRVGIIKEMPDELTDFVLPGHYKWPEQED